MYKHAGLLALFASEPFEFGWMQEKKSGHRFMNFNTD